MIIECDSCRTKFRLDDSRITPGGVRVRCTKCQSVFVVKPPPSPDDVSVEEMFGVSTDSGRAPSPPASSVEDEGAGAGMAGDTASFENEREDEGEDETGLHRGEAGEDTGYTGEPEEEAPQPTAGFEGLDFSFAMDRSDEEDEGESTGEAEERGEGEAPEEGFGAGGEAEEDSEFAPEVSGGGESGPADETEEEPSSEWEDSAPGTEGDEEGGTMGFDLGLDENVEDTLRGVEDESTEEEDTHAGWNINIDMEEEDLGEGLGETGVGPSATGLDDDDTGAEAPEDETPGFEEEVDLGAGGFDEAGEDTGLVGNTLGEALEGLEDEEHAGVEEQLRELEKKVIPFNIGTQGDRPAATSDTEEDTEENIEDEEAGDLDWPSTSEPSVPDVAAWLDEDRDRPGHDVASAAAAAGYSTAATSTAAPAAPSKAKAGLLLILLAIIIIGGGVLYFTGAFDSTGGGSATTAEAVVDIELMKGYVVENKTFGNYFAVEAMVRNKTESPQEIKGARAVLFNSSGARIAERLTTPGRVLSAEDLRTMTAAELDKYFKDPTGGTIPAKGVIPVMVLFTDMPVGISEYGVDVIR